MSARTKIAKSLHVGPYADVVFQPSATGEHIKRAVDELHLTGLNINGLVEVHAESPAPALPLSASDAQVLDAQKAIDWRARGAELAAHKVTP